MNAGLKTRHYLELNSMRRSAPLSTASVLLLASLPMTAFGREWSSPNGHYKIEAELIAFDDDTVVLKPKRGKLISAQLEELSDSDKAYVKSKADAPTGGEKMQTWTTAKGMKVRGRAVAYGKKQLNVQRQLGKVLINDQPFKKLEPVRQQIVLQTLSHLEGQSFDEVLLTKWARGLGAEIKSYPLEGVLMELENGDSVGVPFFLFNKDDLEVLEPGWKSWLAASDDEAARENEDLYIKAQAEEYQRDRQQKQRIELLKLEMLSRATGFLKAWEVRLEPTTGYGYPLRVLVPANDSATASNMALQKYPGYRVAAVKRSRELLSAQP
jgi:hypothetical protein